MTIPTRLLLKKEAAAYCGVCLSVFEKACPVRPVKLLDRIPRWDRHALDAWIDGLTKTAPAETLDLVGIWNDGNSDKGARP
jgi:hypothetical protein